MMERVTEWLVFNAQRRRIKRQFAASMGYAGDFENPKTFQEKIQFRKLYGNHAFYALAADKYRVRPYVTAKAGGDLLIPLLGVHARLNEALFDALPEKFIIKANHGCKWHQIVYDKTKLDVRRVVRRFNTLCHRRYGWTAGERHYNFIPPLVVIEELLPGPNGGSPWDYSFFCFNGPSGFDYSFAIVAPDGRSAALLKDWTLISSKIPEDELAMHVKPAGFDVMVKAAQDLSADFDFVRVDLYNVGGKVYFGELTCTPHQGYGIMASQERQKQHDAMWHLDVDNPLLYKPPRSHRSSNLDIRPMAAPHKMGAT